MGRVSLFALYQADPSSMTRQEAREWITKQVINDNRYPICQKLFGFAMGGGIDKYVFGKTSFIAQKMASVSHYANTTIEQRLKAGITFGKGGTTAFKPAIINKDSKDLFGSFGGGVGFDWELTSIDEKNHTATVLVNINDKFDFNKDNNGIRPGYAEKLTEIGAKAGLKSFEIVGEYELKVKLNYKEIEALKLEF